MQQIKIILKHIFVLKTINLKIQMWAKSESQKSKETMKLTFVSLKYLNAMGIKFSTISFHNRIIYLSTEDIRADTEAVEVKVY